MAWKTAVVIIGVLCTSGVFTIPFSIGDFKNFESNVGKLSDSHAELVAEKTDSKKQITRDFSVIKAAIENDPSEDEEEDPSTKPRNRQVDPYAPEVPKRKQDRSLTDVIEEVNKKDVKHNFVEGDIVVTSGNYKRVATNKLSRKWPGGVVPYTTANIFSASELSIIQQSLQILSDATCLQFRAKQASDSNYIHFIKDGGCWSYVGMQGGKQEVSIANGCSYTTTVVHEIMHAIGFWHEQSRPDRDTYVTVLWANIQTGKETNFNKANDTESVVDPAYGYDFASLMHYGKTDFSRNGQNTLQAKSDPNMFLGQDTFTGKITDSDVGEINSLYCANTPINGQWGAWTISSCSVTCGPGTATKTRQCNSPPPSNGGSDCPSPSSSTEQVDCNERSCVVTTDDVTCTFEDGLCGWTSVTDSANGILDWKRWQGSTPSYRTGPWKDHTLGKWRGYFVYLEASTAGSDLHGILQSPHVPASANAHRCFSYNVHMLGKGMGSLEVIVVNLDTNAQTVIREHNGNRKNVWYYNEITLDGSASIQILFKGQKHLSWQSDMALDDIELNDGPCASGPHDCDFEASTCSWTLDSLQYYPLLLNTGRTKSYKYTGPLSAHAGAGYCYAEGYFHSAWKDDESSLTSSMIEPPPAGSVCLSFWYHMYGSNIGTLSVHTVTISGGSSVYETSDGDVDDWQHKEVTIATPTALQVMIKMIRGSSKYGDIGIDDIKVTEGAC